MARTAWRSCISSLHGGPRCRATDAAPPIVLTVDHGLRRESAEEAAWVGHEAARLGFEHATLVWAGPKPASGLQAAARAARYSLMSNFLDREARDGRVPVKRSIVTAHHADDQAETFLMRLARGSGLDGLSGMRPTEVIAADDRSYTILRPLLEVPKARLVATLEARGLTWREDPSNAVQDFERVRVREALELIERPGYLCHRNPAQHRPSRPSARGGRGGPCRCAAQTGALARRAFCRGRCCIVSAAAGRISRPRLRRPAQLLWWCVTSRPVVADRGACRPNERGVRSPSRGDARRLPG